MDQCNNRNQYSLVASMFHYLADVVMVLLASVLEEDGVGWPELGVECKYSTIASGEVWYVRGKC